MARRARGAIMDDAQNHKKNDYNSVDKVTFTTRQNNTNLIRSKRGSCSGEMELTVLQRRWTKRSIMMSVHISILLLFCLILSCCISGSEGSGNNNNDNSDKNSTSTSAPIDIYLHKLGLMLSPPPKQRQEQEGRSLFDHVVNATSAELQDSNHDLSSPAIQANIVDSSSSASSFEFKCDGPDCPTAQFLRYSSGSSSEFHPTVLPRWNTLLEKRKLLVEGKQNISSPQIIQKKKLGPLRIFKYIHNPDELKTLSTTTSTTTVTTTTTTAKTTTTPVPKVVKNSTKNGSIESAQNEISQDERDQFVNTSAEVDSEERNDQSDRSLIPNSFFSSSGSKELVKASPNETKNIVVNGTDLDEADAFRSRRSPFRPHWRDHKLYPTPPTGAKQHSREALYQMAPGAPPTSYTHPPPPGYASVPIAMPKHSHANPMIQHALVPISAPVMRPSSPIPYPSNPISVATDRKFVRNNNNFEGGPDAESPEEQGSFRMNSFKKPPNKRGRRPPHRSGKRPPGSGPVPSVMPPPKPIPVPIPVPVPAPNNHRPHPHNHHHHHPPHHNHHSHHHPRGSHSHVNHRPPPPHGGPPPPNPQPLRAHPSVQYSYPKDAANIQDILSYFKTEENEIGGPLLKNSQGSSNVPSLSGGGGISSEFRDIHSSLLKDIQNFAKRPSMMSKDSSRESSPGSSAGPKDSPSTLPLLGPEDPLDDILDPKPKPVRGMTRTQNRHREEESFRDKGKSSNNNNHDRDRDVPYKEASTKHRYDDDDDDYNFEEIKRKKRPKSDRHRGHRNPAHDDDDEDIRDEEYHHSYDRKEKRTRSHRKGHKGDYDDRREFYDERPHANNIHSDVYTRDGERERHRDYGVDHHYSPKPSSSSSSSSSRRPSSKSHRHHRQKSHRHKSKSKYSDYHSNDKYRHHYNNREREALGSRERETMRQAPQKVVHHHRSPPAARPPSPPKLIQMTPMDQAYYQQRNRPVVIKRPYSPYRPVDVKKIEQRRKHHDKYWNSVDVVKVVDNKPTNNLLSPTYSRPMTSSGSSTLPQPVQTHYHYYGIGASPGISTTVSQRMPMIPASTTRRPVRINPNDLNGSVEGEIVEIHHSDGGGVVLPEISSTPMYTGTYSSGGPYNNYNPNTQNSYAVEENKKAHMHKMYMNYLQKKLEAEAEAQAEAMMNQPMMPNSVPNVITHSMPSASPTTLKPTKRPMRMKIHIYPNEKVQVVDHSQANPQTVYYSNPNGAYAQPAPPPPTNVYSSSPPGNVHRSYGHYEAPSSGNIVSPVMISNTPHHHQSMTPHHHQSIPPHPMSSSHHRNPSRSGQPPRSHTSTSSASQGSTGDKNHNNNNNKNLVLHLHVHRRNDNLDSGQMEMAGSETVTSTVKPLTYEDIYAGTNNDMEVSENAPENHQLHPEEEEPGEEEQQPPPARKNSQTNNNAVENDKSLSVELPIHHDKIDDVLSTLLKLRE